MGEGGGGAMFRRAVLVLSDQQLVTGVAILVAAFANLEDVSVFHYTFAVQLAWLSSNVHLSTMLFLRGYLRAHPRYLWFRISGMVVLFLMLMVALIPTHMSALSLMNEDVSRFRDMRPANGIPAGCLWKVLGNWTPPQEQLGQFRSPAQRYFPKGNIPVDGQAVLSTIILFFTFVWRLMSMFDISRDRFQHMFRDRPSLFLDRKIQRYMGSAGSLVRRFLRWSLRVTLIILYLIHTLLWDALDSYAGSIWLITINLSVGTGQLIQIRSQLPPTIREEEATWTFGQIMPLALLALPIIAVAEDMLTKPPTPQSSRTDSSISTSSPPGNNHASTITNDTKYPATQYTPLPPPNTRTNSPSAPLPIQTHLLASKLYTLLFWETHAMLAFTAIWLPISRISFGKGENFWLNYMFIPMTIGCSGGRLW
ncbi:hypothetical protein BDZ85DRAFT_267764 [Elsinoe ampelina]|uniref:Uncharacterized protein n=1 Tax=Elsinoe ampelina TaxID=302913 RepID=A0A6A6G2B8_9PEZI|nr:hypothetical protein BDZ85DRAFT_267764 [Elsinoe ampelina]